MSELDPSTVVGLPAEDEAPDAPAELDIPQAGARIGRYVVLSTLGSGGMGVVLAAYDPELDRKAALKLLRPRGDQLKGRERLRREAQALAKLNHPNVVTVYDVGMHEGLVFVAMEFVAGRSLDLWFAEHEGPRPWPELLRVFVAAARGLAAAHEAGFVHRDFKPGNVMLGDDQRVRVMDFGLVRREGEDDSISHDGHERSRHDATASGSLEGLGSLLDGRLTRTGASVGTPAYMAPEQWRRAEVTALADQFSFCVALYEGLYGRRPFAGDKPAEVYASLRAGELAAPVAGVEVPGWLRKIVLRGLEREPERRFASMRELADALDDNPTIRRRRWAALGFAASLLAGALWFADTRREADAQVCMGMDAKLEGTWDAPRRAELEAALLGSGLGHAPETWTRVAAGLDAYAEAWVAQRVAACEATQRGEQSGELLDRRMACLDRRLEQLRTTVDILAQGDAKAIKKAVGAVLELPPLEPCADVEALLREHALPEDPQAAAAVGELAPRIQSLDAHYELGQYRSGLALADTLVREAEALGHAPLLVHARLGQGRLQSAAGEFEQAAATLEDAYHAALTLRMHGEAAHAASKLVYVHGFGLGVRDRAELWGRHAASTATAGEVPRYWAEALNNLGIVAALGLDNAAAERHFERALALKLEQLGPTHPSVAVTVDNLGNIARIQGRFAAAHEHYDRSLAIREQTLGPTHPDLANTLGNLGLLALAEGDFTAAKAFFVRAKAIKVDALGPEHPAVAVEWINLGQAAAMQGELDEARTDLERALQISEAAFEPGHPELFVAIVALAELELMAGRLPRAHELVERATASAASMPADDPLRSLADFVAGWLALAEARPSDAIAALERVLATLEPSADEDLHRPRAQLLLARALWDAGDDAAARARARELAMAARAHWAGDGKRSAAALVEADTWLREHP